jgi:hypothetical protein
MIALICFVLAVVASPFKSNIRLEAENAVLRHQLIVLRRKLKGGARLTNNDRWFFVQLYRWFPSILPVLMIIRATVSWERWYGVWRTIVVSIWRYATAWQAVPPRCSIPGRSFAAPRTSTAWPLR